NNVIIQNLEIFDSYDGDWGGTTHSTDGITVYGAKNVWIDQCWINLCADGALDIRSNGASAIGDFVTVSYTRFSDHNKVMLIASSDNNTFNQGYLNVTLHHCWFDGTIEKGVNQRMPRVRFGDVHVLNNYYEEIGFYCIAANFESDLYVENTYFRNSSDPHIMNNFGQGIEDPDLVAVGNIYEYSSSSQATGGDAFLPGDFYTYTPDPTHEIPALVMNEAGTFNAPDNIAPVANPDTLELMNLTALVVIEAVDNDTDADGGDLRLGVVVNETDGEVGIQSNRILYKPNPNATDNDTLLYQLVDTQGGIDTGMVVILNPFTSTKDRLLPDAALSVSPNPVVNEALVRYSSSLTDAIQVQVFDLAGRAYHGSVQEQASGAGTYQFTLNTRALAAGTYIVQVRQGQWLTAERFVVAK
ncbi:MAG: T9SS type A sorting domain-containing protein, partial [Phaeodactylibacter sp.]|nr:T9SS type A sorting domain-containing protein [Phaeodactylibacter sp.]